MSRTPTSSDRPQAGASVPGRAALPAAGLLTLTLLLISP